MLRLEHGLNLADSGAELNADFTPAQLGGGARTLDSNAVVDA